MFSKLNSGGTPIVEGRVLLTGYMGLASFTLQKLERAGVLEEPGDCRVSSSSQAVSSSEGAVGGDRVAAASTSVNLVVDPKLSTTNLTNPPAFVPAKAMMILEVTWLCKQMAQASNSLASCMSLKA